MCVFVFGGRPGSWQGSTDVYDEDMIRRLPNNWLLARTESGYMEHDIWKNIAMQIVKAHEGLGNGVTFW